jgi:hypothetical protein
MVRKYYGEEINDYSFGSNYKATIIVCSGTKQDLLDSLSNTNFMGTINDTYAKLPNLAESI